MSSIKLKDVLVREHSFCVLPFIHKHIDLNNEQKVCCISNDQIDERRLAEIRTSMMNNQPVQECANCLKQEQLKTFSERQLITREWMRRYPDIDFHTPQELSYDLRYSNLCNLRCQTCNAKSSSEWGRYLGKEDVYKTVEPESISISPNAKRIYLAGGEPFMIKDHFKILRKIQKKPESSQRELAKELGFSFTGSEPFTAFALKIVLTGTSSCYPPRVKDMRGIALAV